jgi:hypothetical protein
MKTFTIADIRSWKPCYDPNKFLPKNWSGTVFDILNHETIPPKDKLWVVCRKDLIDAKTLRLFAVWCARQVEHLMTDERSKAVLVVAEKFAHGEATEVELTAARDAARDAWAAAWAAARDAARDAAGDVARNAAWAAWAAAWDAARTAARDAAWAAARNAAWAGAGDAAGDAPVGQLLKMVEDK